MKYKTITSRRGFTLIELMVTIMIASIVILGIGFVFVDGHRGWSRMYTRVHGEVVTDAYVARKAFDSVCRKSSRKRCLLGIDGEFVEVYYYNSLASTELDRYANFYRKGDKLNVSYGELDPATFSTQPASSTVTLARNVSSVDFSVVATSVRMILALDNGREALMVTSTAIRHNQ